MVPNPVRVRPLRGDDEVLLVARRMRATLMEVLGPERGHGMYSLDWLQDRVRQHLVPGRAVLLAELDGEVVGHTIVRPEHGVGLYSTFWVHPRCRRRGVATALLEAGVAHFAGLGIEKLATHTAIDNERLIAFLGRHGFRVVLEEGAMVRLERPA